MAQKRTRRTTITRSLADKFSQKLEQLPEKKKVELTPKELIFENLEQLDDLLKRGYDYNDLVALLKEDGIQLSKATLRQYLREARKHRTNQDKTTKDKTHRAEKSLAQPDKAQHLPKRLVPETLTHSEQRSPNKFSKGRLQSDENPDRYPDGHGKPLEIKTDL